MLEPDKEIGEHTTEGGEELIVMVEGEAKVTSGKYSEMVQAPCVVLVPAHTVYNVKNTSKSLLKYVYIVVTID